MGLLQFFNGHVAASQIQPSKMGTKERDGGANRNRPENGELSIPYLGPLGVLFI